MKFRIFAALIMTLIFSGAHSQCFVSYIPAGYKNLPTITVYVQYNKSSDYYIGYTICNRFDSAQNVYNNHYEIFQAFEYKFDGNQMTKTGNQILFNMESEFALMVKGRDDHTGGVHGDEQYLNIKYFLNGKEKVFNQSENLIPCREFCYEQNSSLHESPKKVNGVIISNPLHPIEALHYKRTVFRNSGYQTFNRVIWQKQLEIDHWFFGICCVHKDNGIKYYNNVDKKQYSTKGDSEFTMKDILDSETVTFVNDSTKLGTIVTSKLMLPKNTITNTVRLMVWDRKYDTKYYRGYYPLSMVKAGEEWEGKMTVKHFRKDKN